MRGNGHFSYFLHCLTSRPVRAITLKVGNQFTYIHDTVVADHSYQWDLASHQVFFIFLVVFYKLLKTTIFQTILGYDLIDTVSQTDIFFSAMIHNASINSKCENPPPCPFLGEPPGNFLIWANSLPPWLGKQNCEQHQHHF